MKIIEILRKEGLGEEEIEQKAEELLSVVTQRLYEEMVSCLKKEDLIVLEACGDEEEANREIEKRFWQRTGISPQQLFDKLLTDFLRVFLKESRKA